MRIYRNQFTIKKNVKKRRKNFLLLDDVLKEKNSVKINLDSLTVPMIYPMWNKKRQPREILIKNRVYIAIYWPNVMKWATSDSIECQLVKELIPLPIDQRYGKDDMKSIIKYL